MKGTKVKHCPKCNGTGKFKGTGCSPQYYYNYCIPCDGTGHIVTIDGNEQ